MNSLNYFNDTFLSEQGEKIKAMPYEMSGELRFLVVLQNGTVVLTGKSELGDYYLAVGDDGKRYNFKYDQQDYKWISVSYGDECGFGETIFYKQNMPR